MADTTALYPLKLPPSFREKIWGSRDLSPLFGVQPNPIGEAWYTFEENVIANGAYRGRTLGEVVLLLGARLMGGSYQPSTLRRRSAGEAAQPATPRAYFPVLSKLLFTSDKLSVQVHPDDSYALAHEGGPGKTEMWYVVQAAPGASIALGLTRHMSPAEMRSAAESGAIEQFLNWVPVQAGQVFFVPPGTLHSIGAGLVLCEIQQNSDLTYRFFDFGRAGDDGNPRALHIDQAVAVTKQGGYPGPCAPFPLPGDKNVERELLAACKYFATERMAWSGLLEYQPDPGHADLLIFIHGEGRMANDAYAPGDAYLIPAEAPPVQMQATTATEVIRSYIPEVARLREELRRAGATIARIADLIP